MRERIKVDQTKNNRPLFYHSEETRVIFKHKDKDKDNERWSSPLRKIIPITLTDTDRAELEQFLRSGTTRARYIKHANVILKLADGWSPPQIAFSFDLDVRTVLRLKARFLTEGLQATLIDKARSGPPRKIDGNHKAVIVATTCTAPPPGHSRWTLRLLADKVVELELIDTISHTAVGEILKKTN